MSHHLSRSVALLLPALLLGACTQAPVSPPTAAPTPPSAPVAAVQRPGIYAVSFQGVGTPDFSAAAQALPGLAAQGLVGVAEQFTFARVATSTFMVRATGTRHVQATFDVTNNTGTPVPSLTFVPVVTSTSGGTTFSSVTRYDGSAAPAKAAILQAAAAQKLDLTTGAAATDPAATPFLTGLDVSQVQPPNAVAVRTYGWQLGGTLAPGASGRVTFAVEFPTDAGGAAQDPFNFSLLLTTASDVPTPAFSGTLKSAVQQLDPVSKTFGNYTRLVTQTYTENGATVTHSLPAYYDLSNNTPAVLCSFDANLLLSNISTASFPNRYRVEVTSRAAHQLQVYAGTTCPATEGTPLLTQTVTGVAPQGQTVVGSLHSLALKADGTVQSWGFNSRGQLGNGTNTSSNVPVSVTGLGSVVGLAGGKDHSLALKADGTVRSWGGNLNGQLGNGTTTDSKIPVSVTGLSGVVGLAGGSTSTHSLALKADGTVQSWGNNTFGQLGDGTKTNRNVPISVTGLSDVVGLAGGERHSLALKADGTVRSWGQNLGGQLGNGTNTESSVPVSVTGLGGVVGIAGGLDHSLALKADGTVQSWGNNNFGKLGDGTLTFRNVPVSVTGLSGVMGIAGGHQYSLALKVDGTVQSWGANYSGQLGDGTTTSSSVPVSVTGLGGVVSIAGGGGAVGSSIGHSLALKADGTVQSWGNNQYGQLGNGTNTNRNTPGPASISGVAQPTP